VKLLGSVGGCRTAARRGIHCCSRIRYAPGSGRASKLRRPWRFEDYADHLLRVLEQLDLRDITLIGHSNSAAVAMIAGGSVKPAASRIALRACRAISRRGVRWSPST